MKIAGGSLVIQREKWRHNSPILLVQAVSGRALLPVDFRLLVDELGDWMTRLNWNGRMAGGGCDGSGSILRRGGKIDTMKRVSGKDRKSEKSSGF